MSRKKKKNTEQRNVCKRKSLLIIRNHGSSVFHSPSCSVLIRPRLLLLFHTVLPSGTVPNTYICVSLFDTTLFLTLKPTQRCDRNRHRDNCVAICPFTTSCLLSFFISFVLPCWCPPALPRPFPCLPSSACVYAWWSVLIEENRV